MSLPFDPLAPLCVPTAGSETHTLKKVMFKGIDRVARHYVVRKTDGVADGPFMKFYHYGNNSPERAGVYIDGKPGPEWHTYHSDGTPFTIEHAQADGTVRVEGVDGKPVPLLGIKIPHPKTGKLVKDGWWYDREDLDMLFSKGVEQGRRSVALPELERASSRGPLGEIDEDTNAGSVLNGLERLAELGRYAPKLEDAELLFRERLPCQHAPAMVRVFQPLGQPFVDMLMQTVKENVSTNNASGCLLYTLHLMDVTWPTAYDVLLKDLSRERVAHPILQRFEPARRMDAWSGLNSRIRHLAAVPTREALASLEARLKNDLVRSPSDARRGLGAFAAQNPAIFTTWADAFLLGAGKKMKGRELIIEALAATGLPEAVPAIVRAAAESSADVRGTALQAIKGLSEVAEEGLLAATKTGTAKQKATAARLLQDHRRRQGASTPDAVQALHTLFEAHGSADIAVLMASPFAIHTEGTLEEVVTIGRRARAYDPDGHGESWFESRYWALSEAQPAMLTLRLRKRLQRLGQGGFRVDLDSPEAAWFIDQLPVELDRLTLAALEKKAPQEHLDVLLAGLATPTKKVRKKLVDALASLGTAVLPALLPHLERDIESQQAAAAILLRIGDSGAAMALQVALKSAPDKATRTALEEALNACGGPAATTTSDAATETAPATKGPVDWEAVLTKAKKGRALKWLAVQELELKLEGRTALSDDAILGVITLLRKEHERPDPTIWALREHLDPDSAHAFGRAIYNGWAFKAKATSSHKWAVYAIAPFVDERSLTRIGPTIDGLSSGGRHAHAGWLLEAFARSKNRAGMDWVGHWADYGKTRTVSGVAKRLVEQEARRRGLSLPHYKGTLDSTIAAKGVEDDLPAQARWLPRVLEEGMVGGRVWEAKRFHWLQNESTWVQAATGLVFDIDGTEAMLTDKGFSTATGEGVMLPEDGRFRLLHPLEIADLSAWPSKKQQPFDQLQRTTFAKADDLDIPVAAVKPTKALDRFNASLWRHGEIEDAGWYYSNWMLMPSRGVGRFELHHSGIHVADPAFGDPVKAASYDLVDTAGERMKVSGLDGVAFSELQRAIYAIFPQGKGPQTSKGLASSSNLKMSSGYPTADLAPSNRAKCIVCGEKVVKGSVRLVVEREISTPYFTGRKPAYLHPGCSAKFAADSGFEHDDVVATALAHTELDQDVEAQMRAT